MKKLILFLIGLVILTSSVNANPVLNWNSSFGAYEVGNCLELQNVSLNLSGRYALINDINCSDTINWNGGQGFNPIGNYSPISQFFTGNLDGRNYLILNLYINRPSVNYQGLFGRTSSATNIKNLHLVNVSIIGQDDVGALAGFITSSTIINTSSSGVVNGRSRVGGLIGYIYASSFVYDSFSSADIYGTGSGLGGFLGITYTANNIYRSFASGNVTGLSTSDNVGGFSGALTHTDRIHDCYSMGNVSGRNNIGGFSGIGAIFNKTYSVGLVLGTGINVGGLSGSGGSISSGTSSFWDIETSSKPTSSVGTGKSTAEMRDIFTFTSWNFIHIWGITHKGKYPFLIWEDFLEPNVTFSESNPPDGFGTTGKFILNVTIKEHNLKEIKYTFNDQVSVFIFNRTNLLNQNLGLGVENNSWELFEYSLGEYYFTLNQSELISNGSYNYLIQVTDWSGNSDSTLTRVIKGNSPPNVLIVQYSPKDLDSIDPKTNITIYATIQDADFNLQNAFIQWKNTSDSWDSMNNISMDPLNNLNDFIVNFSGIIELPEQEGNFSFRIFAKDNEGEEIYSEEFLLISFWDCSWQVGPTEVRDIEGGPLISRG
jgi:hypothetical protein